MPWANHRATVSVNLEHLLTGAHLTAVPTGTQARPWATAAAPYPRAHAEASTLWSNDRADRQSYQAEVHEKSNIWGGKPRPSWREAHQTGKAALQAWAGMALRTRSHGAAGGCHPQVSTCGQGALCLSAWWDPSVFTGPDNGLPLVDGPGSHNGPEQSRCLGCGLRRLRG